MLEKHAVAVSSDRQRERAWGDPLEEVAFV